ncbi:MAG: hypothetical protein MUO82_08185 [Candidatus Thermoplasmatota archaeon]|nr:hypothetical protein [Candidatus Thermoplasmatota archaeon]
MTDERKKFEEHIIEGWTFSKKIVENILKVEGHIAANLELSIFEKYVSPFFYFTARGDIKATERQIILAKKLGIKDPEQYSKKEMQKKLSEVIDDGKSDHPN